MTQIPVTGNPIIDTATKVSGWLGEQVERIVQPPAPAARAPNEMTNEQLHGAIHVIGAKLQNKVALTIQHTFKSYGATMGDPRIPIAMPTTVLAHTMTMVAEANDSYALALLGLRDYATTSALGPIRNIAETYAYAMWLLESPDEKVRLARAYPPDHERDRPAPPTGGNPGPDRPAS
jgi:hypothetical protein